ncbi:MAG: hypothetical protein CFH19_01276 [Alphaproteobacteria bacterium MarineAlpha5_Bin9]|nr:MAG: hypothetical protein CFH19_01276 [Alphaproteobacteria bacterium MarineAlpha5_Bin9]|tara:strand:- start:1275 stop:2540 length:1266 start_codon:yes stop_codon:yes gene_type:complete
MEKTKKIGLKLSWAFYDWANSAWSAMIITFVFSRYFVDVLSSNPHIGTLYWTWTIGISSLVAALMSPIFGSMSDQSQKSKNWLIITTLIYSIICFLFWFTHPINGLNIFILLLFIFIGNLSYEISQIFYNGQLKVIAVEENYAKISGLSWGLGYIGTVIIFISYYAIFLLPEGNVLNLNKENYEHIRISFPITGLWILIFSIPLFITFKEKKQNILNNYLNFKDSLKQIIFTLKNISRYKNLLWFLISRLFYMDGINAIFAVAAIYATIVFGMDTSDIILLGIGTNLAAGIGSWVFSFIEKNLGSKNVIVLSLSIIFVISTIILFINVKIQFIILAIILSSFFGPIQSASRVYFAKNIPNEKKYEFFGFYSFSGKVTAFIGPVMYGTVSYIFKSPKMGMASLLILFLIGLIILLKVKNDKQ